MRRLAPALLVILILTALILPPTAAQEPPTPTPAPTTNDPSLVQLPFSDTFDTNAGWQASGLWAFVADTAYEGGGWFVDGIPRETISALEYVHPIDLQGTLTAQLYYRQQGNLPSSDLIALDLSLDGGNTWFLIDLQTGVEAHWETHIVDLTPYRGQVIRLRFRVNTGIAREDEATPTPSPADPSDTESGTEPPLAPGYWIDNVSIQYVIKPPPTVYTPPSGIALMGLHLLQAAPREPVLAFVRQMRDAGWPLSTVKGTNGTDDLLKAIKAISPETVIVYRTLITHWGETDCPDQKNPPVAEAQRWMGGVMPFLTGVPADYYEIMNECAPDPGWLVPFTIEAMRIATQQGACLLVFSFGTGQPEIDVYRQFLPVYQYAVANPCRPGQYHGIALHAYGVERETLLSESGLFLGLRHRLYYAQILPIFPDAIKLPLYLTEAGPGDGGHAFPCEDVARDVVEYTQELEYDPYVRGFNLWNIGRASYWVDYSPCLPVIADALIRYYRR
jgi:hypothetical protein